MQSVCTCCEVHALAELLSRFKIPVPPAPEVPVVPVQIGFLPELLISRPERSTNGKGQKAILGVLKGLKEYQNLALLAWSAAVSAGSDTFLSHVAMLRARHS